MRHLLLRLSKHVIRGQADLYITGLLAHQAIQRVEYLRGEIRLSYRTGSCCERERPENQHADSSRRGFVYPLLLADNGENAAGRAVHRHGKRGLHP